MQKLTVAILTLAALTLGTAPLHAQSLKGSRMSMERQNQEAVRYGYAFLRTPQAVSNYVNEGHLVRVSPNQHFELHDVSHPFARPAVKTFIDRLSTQYHSACGEKMTVTSLTRPINKQPSNAASDSVHPTGMAVDLRIPSTQSCRSWLERTLLSLEGTGVLDVTRERHPAHYHVAVFTRTYENYLASLDQAPAASRTAESLPALATTGKTGSTVASVQGPTEYPTEGPAVAATAEATTVVETRNYTVRRGDTLSVIADRMGTTVSRLRAANGLRGNLIRAGQKLDIPASGTSPIQISSATARANEVAAVTEVTHRVKRGDTLWRIANRYGTSASSLKRQNDLSDDVLQVGQVLHVRPNSR